jgi:DUF4097 and DUF4098 domain-containing protein YvlB
MKNFILTLTLLTFMYSFQSASCGDADDLKLLQQKTLQTEPGKSLTLSSVSGNVIINSWSKNEFEVKIYGNEKAENYLTFDISPTETGVRVDGQSKSTAKIQGNLSVKFEINVPSNYNIDVHTGGGNVKVDVLTGKVNINTSGGNINVKKLTGDVDASTAGGNISIDESKGSVHLSTSGGNISVEKFDGNVDVSTLGGNIRLAGSDGEVKASTAGGNIKLEYSGKSRGVDLSTLAGSINLEIPSDFDADADVSTLAGKINSDFGSPKNDLVSSYLKTTINNGGNKLKCSTLAGDIKIGKK